MLALYRKYRPKSLSDVVGQDQVTRPLSSALKSGKISHSYLFTGPRGCGKTSVARILAHEINGFKYELEDSYLDIIEIDAASNTGVDNIRELREKAIIAPSEGKYKVYIIDEVHMLTKSAFNALLKTLEEPPTHVVFILATTDFEKVPVTITSRSQVYTFRLAPLETMLSHLQSICKKEGIKISGPALNLIAEKGGGSFRDSLSLLDQISSLGTDGKEISESIVANCLGLPMETKINHLLNAYTEGDANAVTENLKILIAEGLKPESIASSCLNKIIAHPTPELLLLLSELPKVTAPYPDAKLLLAFLSNASNSFNPDKKPKAILGSEPKPNSQLQSEIPEMPRKEAVTKENRPSPKPETIEHPKEKPSPTRIIEPPTALTPALSQQLKKCKIIETEDQIDIYPSSKIVKNILSKPANEEILKSNFNKTFVIHDPDDLKNSPEIQKISDIMGDIQEVNDNGGIPF